MAKNKIRSPKKRRKEIQRSNNNARLGTSKDLIFEYPDSRFIQIGMLMIGALFFLWTGLQGVYYEVFDLRISLFFMLCTIIPFFTAPKKRTYIFSKARAAIIEEKEEKTIVHPFDSVIGYYEHKIIRKNSTSKELVLRTKKQTFTFHSSDKGYHLLKQFVIANFDKLGAKYSIINFLKRVTPYFMLFCVFVIVCLWIDSKHEVASSSELGLTTITLLEQPKLDKRYKSFGYDVKFKAKEYPEFNFKIRQGSSKVDLENFSKDDKVNIIVEQHILDMKLLKTKEATFGLKHNHWEDISVSGLTFVDDLIN